MNQMKTMIHKERTQIAEEEAERTAAKAQMEQVCLERQREREKGELLRRTNEKLLREMNV